MSFIYKFLYKPVDNTALALFRIFFGFLLVCEAWGAILTGWVYNNFILPKVYFPFIQFEFLNVLNGPYMYIHFVLMGIFGFLITIGYQHRAAIISYALFWSIAYLMQKTSYNNHYYLLMLLLWFMAFIPADKRYSIKASNKDHYSESMPFWIPFSFKALLLIVYTYASIAKLQIDWLEGLPLDIWLKSKVSYPVVGWLFRFDFTIYTFKYMGIVYDGLIIPALLWRHTRPYAFIASLVFHLMNSITFGIGIFPFLALALFVFFYEPEKLQRIFIRKKDYQTKHLSFLKNTSPIRQLDSISLISFLLIMILLPLRHHLFEDDVNWTEEGHRLSWRMMLRAKTGYGHFIVKTKEEEKIRIDLDEYLTPKQARKACSLPDFIWQFAQFLKTKYTVDGDIPEVYAYVKCNLNGKGFYPLVNSDIDLAAEDWKPFEHHDWINPYPY